MTGYEIYQFLKEHEGTAFTRKELMKRVPGMNIDKKLRSLLKFKYIKSQKAKIDYSTYNDVRVTYYYVGTLREFVPRPKVLVTAR